MNRVNVPVGPVVERHTSQPSSFVELSCQASQIWWYEAAEAVRLVGAPPATPLETSKDGARGSSESQPATNRRSSGAATDRRKNLWRSGFMGYSL